MENYGGGLRKRLIISGGERAQRGQLERYFIRLAIEKKKPLVVLHCNNRELAPRRESHALIDGEAYCSDPFMETDPQKLAAWLTDLGALTQAQPRRALGLWSLILRLLAAVGKLHAEGLMTFPVSSIPEVLAQLPPEHVAFRQEALARYRAVADLEAEAELMLHGLKPFLSNRSREHEPINPAQALERKGTVFFNLGSDTDKLAKEFVFLFLEDLLKYGRRFMLLMDGVSLSAKDGSMARMLSIGSDGPLVVFGGDDIPALLGGDREFFQTLTGNNASAVVLRHSSGESAKMWSGFFGEHDEAQKSVGRTATRNKWSLIGGTRSKSVTFTKERRSIVPEEKITDLADGRAFVRVAGQPGLLGLELSAERTNLLPRGE
ncbi:MAG: hypothetical protein LBK56_09585 [Gracilibacteraceae bacterium]|nr:hypothetical protein [Gracilibacteraceae bacterium]